MKRLDAKELGRPIGLGTSTKGVIGRDAALVLNIESRIAGKRAAAAAQHDLVEYPDRISWTNSDILVDSRIGPPFRGLRCHGNGE
jgi:hypothetical protein